MPAKGSGKGYIITRRGYVMISRRGPDHGKLEHRVVMARMCREWCYWPLNGDGLPEGMEVHHHDFKRDHNCPSNLILMDPALHLHMDRLPRSERDRLADGTFGVQPTPPVGSIVFYEEFHCPDCGLVRKVPVSWHDPEDVPDWVVSEELP